MITVTFHISCKKHSLTKTRDVVSVSKHNLRLFQSEEYNEEMIEVEVGSEVNILDDVKEIYEREFSEALAEYNKGKRSDRQIHDYLEYVSENKKNCDCNCYPTGTSIFCKREFFICVRNLKISLSILRKGHPQ